METFCSTLVTRKESGYVTEVISELNQLYVVGTIVKHSASLPLAEQQEVHLALGNCNNELTEKPDLFARLKHGKDVIHSELYARASKRNSSVVAFHYKGQF